MHVKSCLSDLTCLFVSVLGRGLCCHFESWTWSSYLLALPCDTLSVQLIIVCPSSPSFLSQNHVFYWLHISSEVLQALIMIILRFNQCIWTVLFQGGMIIQHTKKNKHWVHDVLLLIGLLSVQRKVKIHLNCKKNNSNAQLQVLN